MALDKASLISTLETIFSDISGKTTLEKATEIADAIDVYVKTATVTTVTTCPAGAGTGTGGLS